MGWEPKMIAPYQSGLSKYFKPWLIGQDAFADLEDAYVWRGSIRKREGYSLLVALPAADKPVQGLKNWVNPSTLNESLVAFSQTLSYLYNTSTLIFNNISFLTFGGPGRTNPGTAFLWTNTVNDFFWASNYAGSLWVTNNLTADHIRYWDGTPGVLGASGGWSIHQPVINGTTRLNAALIILPYKGRLVVLNTTEDTQLFPTRARWSQIGTPYTGNSAGVTITNITAANPAVVSVAVTTSFTVGQKAGVLNVVGSMGPLLNFNQYNISAINPGVSVTIDVSTVGLAYTSRGTLYGTGSTSAPAPFSIDVFGWRDDIPGRGGFVDADTSQRIVSAEIVKDTLIVFFTRSTWRLRYTGNEILPFIWERLNTQYGAESTYSNIAFDEAALAFSRFGWIGADTNDAARIDEEIPDDSFSIGATATFTGLSHVQGIRDFYRQIAYWTFQTMENSDLNLPNQIYSYNYLDKKWAIFNPSGEGSPTAAPNIRVFGYFHTLADSTWSTFSIAPKHNWSSFNSPDSTWSKYGTGANADFPYIVGGDQNGNVYTMFEFSDPDVTDNGTNFDYSIFTKRFNPYLEEGQKAKLGYVDLYVTSAPGASLTLNHFIDDESGPITTKTVNLYDQEDIFITAVSLGATTTFTTQEFHNLQVNQNVTITGLIGSYSLQTIFNNQTFIVSAVPTSTTFTVAVNTSSAVFSYTSSGKIWTNVTDDFNSDASYVRVFLGAIGRIHQLELTLNTQQLADPVSGTAQLELQGMVLWWRKEGRIRR